MMTKYLYAIISITLILSSCRGGEEENYSNAPENPERNQKASFEKQKELATGRSEQLFSVYSKDINREEKEALEFLYAYMPLGDLADYDGEFFLKHVRAAFEAREHFPWGKDVPKDIFRHFVLPVRVNDENLDTSRMVFLKELKDRLSGMEIGEAALEINYWCREKVDYKLTDDRTSSPLATVKNAFGRCGEESVFTVSALRAACIPARQVYVPRWSHSDDNHAWVEYWDNGRWHYMGACEPMPAPDMGWFTEPARRAMLVHTKSFGGSEGSDGVAVAHESYDLLNLLSRYADTKTLHVCVTDTKGRKVPGAIVEFQLYNFAAFHTIMEKTSNSDGFCSFDTGFGDLFIWARHQGDYGFKKVAVANIDTINIQLDKSGLKEFQVELDMNPPERPKARPEIVEDLEENTLRIQQADRIRAAYKGSFPERDDAELMAEELKLDGHQVWRHIEQSCGNYQNIYEFLKGIPASYREWGLSLLDHVSQKDLRDVESEVLLDHMLNATNYGKEYSIIDSVLFVKYLLNPRVEDEKLVAYRGFFQKEFEKDFIKSVRKDIKLLTEWLNNKMKLDHTSNYYGVPMSPVGSYQLGVCDQRSHRILLVAICRSFGIPSRLEPGTLIPQYWEKGQWKKIQIPKESEGQPGRGVLHLIYEQEEGIHPAYFKDFSLAKFENGKFNPLKYSNDIPFEYFSKGIELESGKYMLVTGSRIEGGTALVGMQIFEVRAGESRSVFLKFRNTKKQKSLIHFDLNREYQDIYGREKQLSELGAEKFVLLWLDPDTEPGRHIMQELESMKNVMNDKNVSFLFFIPEKYSENILLEQRKHLPESSVFGYDKNKELLQYLGSILTDRNADHLPIVMLINQNGEILYLSSGYSVGTVHSLFKRL